MEVVLVGCKVVEALVDQVVELDRVDSVVVVSNRLTVDRSFVSSVENLFHQDLDGSDESSLQYRIVHHLNLEIGPYKPVAIVPLCYKHQVPTPCKV